MVVLIGVEPGPRLRRARERREAATTEPASTP